MKEIFNFVFKRIIFAAFAGFILFLLWNWFIVPTFGLTLLSWKFCAIAGVVAVFWSDIHRGQYIISEIIKPWQLIVWAGVIYLLCLLLS